MVIDWSKTIAYWAVALFAVGILFFLIGLAFRYSHNKRIGKGLVILGWMAGFSLLLLAPSISQLLFRLQRTLPWWQFNRSAFTIEPLYFLVVILIALFFYFWWLIKFGKRVQANLLAQAQHTPPERRPDQTMNPKLKFILALVTLLLLSAFLVFIWPTPYKYSKVYIRNWDIIKRTSRFTGRSQIRVIKAMVPELEKWQYDTYRTALKIPGVDEFAQELAAGKHPNIFDPKKDRNTNIGSGVPLSRLDIFPEYEVALAYLYEANQDWIWLDWY